MAISVFYLLLFKVSDQVPSLETRIQCSFIGLKRVGTRLSTEHFQRTALDLSKLNNQRLAVF